MKKNNQVLLAPQRQPLAAIFILASNSFRGLIMQFWPILLLALLNRSGSGSNYWFIIGAIGLGIISFVLSVVGYFRFTFSVEADEVVIEQGVFTRVRTAVPFRRVQSINFEQKVLHRLLGLVSFRIDTAGSEQSEITIPAMHFQAANELRSMILEQRASAISKLGKLPDEIKSESKQDVIFHLTIRDLLKVGVSVNHLRTMGIILAVVWGLYAETSDIFEEMVQFALEARDIPTSGPKVWMYFAILVPVLFIITFLTSLILTVLRFFNLKVYRISGGLKVVAGLLNRKEQTAKRKKTQVVTWVTNPIRRMFGMFNVRLKQASSAEVNTRQAIVVPGCYEDQVDMLKSFYFGRALNQHFEEYGIRKEIVLRYSLYFGLIPVLAGGTIIFFVGDVLPWFLLAWLPMSYVMFSVYHRKWRVRISDQLLFTQKGIFGLRMDMVYLHKIQSVTIFQTPYQQRKKLANLHIQTASGRMVIPYLYLDFAEHLMNYFLYKIESSRRAWM